MEHLPAGRPSVPGRARTGMAVAVQGVQFRCLVPQGGRPVGRSRHLPVEEGYRVLTETPGSQWDWRGGPLRAMELRRWPEVRAIAARLRHSRVLRYKQDEVRSQPESPCGSAWTS